MANLHLFKKTCGNSYKKLQIFDNSFKNFKYIGSTLKKDKKLNLQ